MFTSSAYHHENEHAARIKALQVRFQLAKNKTDKRMSIFGKASCQQLCKKVFTKLPTELRQSIYGFLVSPNYISFPQDNSKFGNYWPDQAKTDHVPVQYTVEYVGRDFARELTAYCYRTVEIKISSYQEEVFRKWLSQVDAHRLLRVDYVNKIELSEDVDSKLSERAMKTLQHMKPGVTVTFSSYKHPWMYFDHKDFMVG
jgi:hypothetical protein